jgi:hypothetical protein
MNIEIVCPRCARTVEVHKGIKIIVCFECGLRFPVEKPNLISQFFYRLWFKIKKLAPDWIVSNWTRITTKVEFTVISNTTIYENHCWFCGARIRSVKSESKLYWLGNKWLGNTKCERTLNGKRCKYFLCNECGRCLCDRGDFNLGRANGLVEKKWLLEHSTSENKQS